MANTLEELQQEARKIHGQYSFRFAGHPRITRDTRVLDGLIDNTQTLSNQITELPGNGSAAAKDELAAQTTERLDLYKREREAIVEVQLAGPAAREASLLGTRANYVIGRYRRHFAGRDRKTRDLGILSEMIQDLQKIKEEMRLLASVHPIDQLSADHTIVSQNLETYIRERAEILAARERLELGEQISNLATIANGYFKLYSDHFAGKERLTRRPGLLRRLIDGLAEIQKSMQGIKSRAISEVNDRNIAIVQERIDLYRQESGEIDKVRKENTLEQLSGRLGAAANELLESYSASFAGQSRETRDLEEINLLCDYMGEIERQMHSVALQENIDLNIKNLSIVRDALAMFDREYQEIKKVKEA